jgi:integrase
MYWARHSWATVAIDLDIPKDTVAAALGHSSNTVTDVYINFDRAKIDRANRMVLDYVLYDKKPQDIFDLIRRMNENVTQIAQKAI